MICDKSLMFWARSQNEYRDQVINDEIDLEYSRPNEDEYTSTFNLIIYSIIHIEVSEIEYLKAPSLALFLKPVLRWGFKSQFWLRTNA